ncbi:prenyltransferase/squalene oxidase repeat-containing protein [Streptomyces sp. NBRC 109706]|uniref:prenyltransferase/squalene oxidase repeat-containing protein n=1 Tax=Streptomyces sp. NBRC 109706 TaxID=1550035 RepID=UPI000A78DF41|nr:prenyltransferase/squalene oxidase repeat-containing protein [Streptomyces sp. NBRC 109706]
MNDALVAPVPERRRPWRRVTALATGALATAALFAGTLLAPGTALAEEPPELASPAEAAVTWSLAQLTDGTHASEDHGLTADLVMAFASTGTAGEAADRATDWLAENATSYVRRGGDQAVNAGGTAKLALVAAIQHRDPGDFGGHDLTGLLLERINADGRFTDAGPAGDMSNQFTQSLGVLALRRTGELPEPAVDFLASTRCADGGYPLSLRRDPSRCTSDTDSTGMAVQALLDAGRTADAEPALDWLEGQQQETGGFGYNASSPPNSNSTALAVQALIAGDRAESAEAGTAWLRSLQAGCAADPEDRGGVGYMEPVINGMALRATAQVIPALAGQPLGEIDGEGAAPDASVIDCSPGSGSGGTSAGSDQGGADSGGASGDGGSSDGGDDGGTSGDPGATDAGGAATGDGGTGDAGSADGGDNTGGGPNAPTPQTSGGSSDGPTSGGSGSGGPGGNGNLADTGSDVLPLIGWAAALLAAGGGIWALANSRRRPVA